MKKQLIAVSVVLTLLTSAVFAADPFSCRIGDDIEISTGTTIKKVEGNALLEGQNEVFVLVVRNNESVPISVLDISLGVDVEGEIEIAPESIFAHKIASLKETGGVLRKNAPYSVKRSPGDMHLDKMNEWQSWSAILSPKGKDSVIEVPSGEMRMLAVHGDVEGVHESASLSIWFQSMLYAPVLGSDCNELADALHVVGHGKGSPPLSKLIAKAEAVAE